VCNHLRLQGLRWLHTAWPGSDLETAPKLRCGGRAESRLRWRRSSDSASGRQGPRDVDFTPSARHRPDDRRLVWRRRGAAKNLQHHHHNRRSRQTDVPPPVRSHIPPLARSQSIGLSWCDTGSTDTDAIHAQTDQQCRAEDCLAIDMGWFATGVHFMLFCSDSAAMVLVWHCVRNFIIYCVSKNDPNLKRYSSKLYGSILMIFGRNIQITNKPFQSWVVFETQCINNKAIVWFRKRLCNPPAVALLQLGWQTQWTLSLNTKRATETFEVLTKIESLIRY